MFEYQKWNKYFAQIEQGMEETGAKELSKLGATEIKPLYRGIDFKADYKALYKINYTARLITRVLAPLISFQCHSTKYLYQTAKSVNWDDLLKLDNTFAIFATVSHSRIKHSKYASLCLKDAIVDFFRDKYGSRPSVNNQTPDVWINLHIQDNKALISFDTSGGSLHRRGYRNQSVEAPMKETLAASLVYLSEWNGDQPFYDPMCGSGTLLSEALMSYCRIPAGYLRKKFGFTSLPDYDEKIWSEVKNDSDNLIRPLPKDLISGSDVSGKILEVARVNLKQLPFGDKVNLQVKDFRHLKQISNATIICNPPFGVRLKNSNEISTLYEDLGLFLKNNCKGSKAFLFLGNLEHINHIGLKASKKRHMLNGKLKVKFCKYEIYN